MLVHEATFTVLESRRRAQRGTHDHEGDVDEEEAFFAFLERLSDDEPPDSDPTRASPHLPRGSADYRTQPLPNIRQYDLHHVLVCCVLFVIVRPSSDVSDSTKLLVTAGNSIA